MRKKEKKKKGNWKRLIPFLFSMLIGAACGVLIAKYMDISSKNGWSLGQEIMTAAGMLLALCVCYFLHIIIHEAGHLVFGLLSGYEFTSFRIMSFMWIKEDGKLRLKRFSLAGTGGQCLMSPPDLVDGKIPVVLYNMGGSIMNLIASLVCGLFYLLIGKVTHLSTVLMIMVLVGIASAVLNGVPMRLGTVDNDGYNAISLRKNPKAIYAFWLQMKINDQISKGIRLKDMPDEWFVVPEEKDMKNSMVAAQGVFICNRLIDDKRFEEADELMEKLLAMESGMVGIHRCLMICDRMYCEMIRENRKDMVEQLMTKEQQKFMKSMKTFPSVMRTEYTYELLVKGNEKKSEKIKEQFEKMAEKYPYPNDIQSERELMDYAKKLAGSRDTLE